MKKVFFFLLLFTYTAFAQEQLTHINTLTGNGSNPYFKAQIGNKTFFITYNGEFTEKLWVTDGTEAGTNVIKGLPDNISPHVQIITKDDFLYFTTWDTNDIWRTDGTETGTKKIIEKVNEGATGVNVLNLVATESYFGVVMYDNNGKTIIKKYDYDFKLISTETSNLYLTNPTTLGSQLIFNNNRVFRNGLDNNYNSSLYSLSTTWQYIDNDYLFGGQIEQKYTISNKLYFVYENNYQFYPNGRGGYLIEYDGTNAQRYNLPFVARKDYNLNMFKSFVYNNQVFIAMIGTNKDSNGAFGSVIEVYALKPNVGFELKLNYFAEQRFDNISNFWADGESFHFLSTRYENSQYYHQEVNFINTQFKRTKISDEPYSNIIIDNGKGQLIFRKFYDGHTRFLFNYKTNNIIKLAPTPILEHFGFMQANNKWFVSASSIYTGSEPHLLDISTGNISLIKDITKNGTGIGQIDNENIINKELVWATIEKDGIIVNKSDGTKAGTSPIKTITTIKSSYNFGAITSKKIDNTLLFDYLHSPIGLCIDCTTPYKHVSFASDGTPANTVKLYESDTLLFAFSSTKIDSNYYTYINTYDQNNNSKIKKYDLNGNLIKEITTPAQNITNSLGKYFTTPTYYSPYTPLGIIDATTGVKITPGNYIKSFNNKIILGDTDFEKQQTSIYVLSDKDNIPQKLFTMNRDFPIYTQRIGNELFFFGDRNTIFVVDSLVQDVKKLPLIIPGNTHNIKKFNNSYLILRSSYEGAASKTISRWQLTSNGVSVELPNAPQTNLSNESIVTSDAIYFSAASYVLKDFINFKYVVSVYRFDGKTIKLAGYLEDESWIDINYLPNAIMFKTRGNKILYWTPTGVEEIGSGAVSTPIVLGKKALFAITNSSNSYSLYATDGTKKGTVLLQNTTNFPLFQAKVINNKLYFEASTKEFGSEPWQTDGTPEGTKMIADLMAGSASSFPSHFTDLNGTPICLANTPNLGKQIFSLKAIEQPNLTADKLQVCEGNKITLSAPAGYQGYIWVSGKDSVKTTANTFLVTKSGNYQVLVENFGARSTASKVVALTVTPFPEKPSINFATNGLEVSTNATQIQWLLNGQEISGEIGKTLKNYGSGAYSVRVSTNGCATTSDAFAITASENEIVSELKAFPNPSTNILNVSFKPQTNTSVELIDASGHQSFQKTLIDQSSSLQINVGSFTKGVYFLKVNNAVKKIVVE